MKRTLALVLALVLCLGLMAGCTANSNSTPLVVGYSPFSSKFSAFFAETAYDQDVATMTGISLLTTDRTGAVIQKGIKGETIAYNGTDYTYYGPADLTITTNDDGTVAYDFTLRDDIKFSDGKKVTIDDVIFSMYALSDPAYDGSSTFFALPIKGMEAYRAGMDTIQNLILKAGDAGYTANDYYTEEQYNTFWTAMKAAGEKFAQSIIDYCLENYADYGAKDAATAAALWNYEGVTDAADFWTKIQAAYGWDLSDAGINAEKATTSISEFLATELGDKANEYIIAVKTGDSADKIEGITKTGDNSLRVLLTEVDATAIYQLGVTIAPLHYYGDTAKYDYDNNKFGFDKGDLSSIRAKISEPMGAGPYKFIKFENGVVSFEANNNYYLGKPKTRYINFLETQDTDKLNGVVTGTIDITDPSFSTDVVKAIQQANGGELNGDKITTNTVDNLGYGYLGINAKRVSVGNDIGSAASKNLRKALATVFAVYRDVTVDSYYGERASVINYPISNTSWAAPQKTDADYKVAFSVDAEGKDIYTSDMSTEDRYAAALNASLGFFAAAGYTVTDGKVTAAPTGAKMEFEVWIPADGSGDHPSFMMLTEAAKAFEKIGIKLNVKDLTNSSDLWTAMEATQVDMWCAAWGATPDPDMYQIYFSGDGDKKAGGSNYMYAINDPELNKMILDARKSMDLAYRKQMYKACLDTIVDWAVEIPVYQRQNAIIFSTERVDIDSVTPDITTFYGWMAEIQNLKLK